MISKNYAAWQVSASEFPGSASDESKLRYLLNYGILAPSGHNTQPWKFQLAGGALKLLINRDHFLSIDGSGMLSVEPLISLGTFLGTLELAAKGFGYELEVNININGDEVAIVRLGKRLKAAAPELLKAITGRVSNRYPFETTPLSASEQKAIFDKQFADVSAVAVASREDIDFVAGLTEQATGSIMGKPEYRLELSNWVRTNQTRRYDGMPGFTHGFGSLKSLVSKAAIKHAPGQGPQAKHSAELITTSGALAIVCCHTESEEAFVNAGRQYANICINAGVQNIASSALGAAALDPKTRQTLKQHFGFNNRPVFLLRLGKATRAAKHAPRWPVEKLLEN